MKKLRIVIVTAFLGLLTACGGTKQATTNNQNLVNEQTTNRGRSNINAETQETIKRAGNTKTNQQITNAPQNRTSATTFRNTGADNKVALEKMYVAVEMSDAQISRFEKEWQSFMNSWSRTNRNQPLNNFERTENQDRILKEILDDVQFEKYQQWARENPGSGSRN